MNEPPETPPGRKSLAPEPLFEQPAKTSKSPPIALWELDLQFTLNGEGIPEECREYRLQRVIRRPGSRDTATLVAEMLRIADDVKAAVLDGLRGGLEQLLEQRRSEKPEKAELEVVTPPANHQHRQEAEVAVMDTDGMMSIEELTRVAIGSDPEDE